MKISLRTSRFPRVLGQLSHSVQFFKIAAFASLILSLCLVALLGYSVSRSMEVIALTPEGGVYRTVTPPKAEDEIARAVREYIDRRYNWTSRDVEDRLAAAQAFILPAQRADFRTGVRNVIQFAREKPTARRVYPGKVRIDLGKKVAVVTGDRIIAIQGLWAANELRLSLNFESGPRTAENPWGIYITKEKEE